MDRDAVVARDLDGWGVLKQLVPVGTASVPAVVTERSTLQASRVTGRSARNAARRWSASSVVGE